MIPNMNNQIARPRKPARRPPPPTAFEVDSRITLHVDFDLALELGVLIINSTSENPAILALGHKLNNLAPPEE